MKISSRPDKLLSGQFENRVEASFVMVVLHTVIVRLFYDTVPLEVICISFDNMDRDLL
jgi:hypothetical protein